MEVQEKRRNQNKNALREHVLGRRNAIPLEERRQKSSQISKRLLDYFGTGFFAKKTIAVYQARGSEVSLEDFIGATYLTGVRICFPCMMEPSRMTFRLVSQVHYEAVKEKTPTSAFAASDSPFSSPSVPEFTPTACFSSAFLSTSTSDLPKEESFLNRPLKKFQEDDPLLKAYPLVSAKDIDVVIVPLVAFDSSFNRLGYGGGNYDRFLPQLRNEALALGVAFCEQEVERIPVNKHDQKLLHIISA